MNGIERIEDTGGNVAEPLTLREQLAVENCFEGHGGAIVESEIPATLRELGVPVPPDRILRCFISDVHRDDNYVGIRSLYVNREEFYRIVELCKRRHLLEARSLQDVDAALLFAAMGGSPDGTGGVRREQMMHQLCTKFGLETEGVEPFLHRAEDNEEGVIEFGEFKKLVDVNDGVPEPRTPLVADDEVEDIAANESTADVDENFLGRRASASFPNHQTLNVEESLTSRKSSQMLKQKKSWRSTVAFSANDVQRLPQYKEDTKTAAYLARKVERILGVWKTWKDGHDRDPTVSALLRQRRRSQTVEPTKPPAPMPCNHCGCAACGPQKCPTPPILARCETPYRRLYAQYPTLCKSYNYRAFASARTGPTSEYEQFSQSSSHSNARLQQLLRMLQCGGSPHDAPLPSGPTRQIASVVTLQRVCRGYQSRLLLSKGEGEGKFVAPHEPRHHKRGRWGAISSRQARVPCHLVSMHERFFGPSPYNASCRLAEARPERHTTPRRRPGSARTSVSGKAEPRYVDAECQCTLCGSEDVPTAKTGGRIKTIVARRRRVASARVSSTQKSAS